MPEREHRTGPRGRLIPLLEWGLFLYLWQGSAVSEGAAPPGAATPAYALPPLCRGRRPLIPGLSSPRQQKDWKAGKGGCPACPPPLRPVDRRALAPGWARPYALSAMARSGGEEASEAPWLDPRDFFSVELVGLGEGEEKEVSTAFVGPPAELWLGDEGAGWGGLKAFPRALPIPLAEREDLAIVSSVGGFAGADEASFRLSSLEVAQTLASARDLFSGLPFSEPTLRDAVARVSQGREGQGMRRVEALARVVGLARCSVRRLVFDELDSLSDDSLPLGCYLVFQPQDAEAGYADAEMRAWVPVAAGTALAAHLGLPMLLPRYIWQEAACRVDVRDGQQSGAYERLQGMSVHNAQPAGWRTPLTPTALVARARSAAERGMGAVAPESLQGVPAWELGASDVLALTEEEARGLLRSYGIACKRGQTREDLLEKLMPYMDEVERRAVTIQLAVEEEDYEAASAAKALRSERSELKDQVKRAVEEERFYDAASLQERLDLLTMTRADVTAEEGTYDRFLDADDWYMESIMRSKKAKQERERDKGL